MRWLHLSDIHFGYQNASIANMRKKLIEEAQKLEQVDCLFITGDLRYGKSEQTNYPIETLTFIRDLQTALRIGPEDTYVVPGNHDVNRNNVLTATLDDELKHYSTPDGTIRSSTLDYISSCRSPFSKLYREICGRDEPGWHYCIPRRDFNIICINTAILCGRDGEDGTLAIGSALLNQLADTVDKTKPGIVLAHHDFDSLQQEEQQKLEIILKEIGATIYLCGHKHIALNRLQNTYRSESDLQIFLCGTNMDCAPHLSQTDMDFFVGQTNDGINGWVQAYKWYPRSNQWAQDVEFSIPQGATDGKIYFPKTARPQSQAAIHPDVKNRYFQYIRQQCSEIELSGLPMNEEDASRRYALRQLFIPLKFNMHTNTARNVFEDQGDDITSEPPSVLITNQGVFRVFILSDPGGGKSTLLKWIASVYSFPEEYKDTTHLPKRSIFPVWLRCRDIMEGSRPTIWKSIQDIALRGEWLPHGSDTADFTALVAKHIVDDDLLLLIDGLDEIGSDTDRDHFVEQLRSFASLYPNVNIIVSSRPTGLSLVTKGLFPDFRIMDIAPLDDDDIRNLCIKWNQVVRGDSESIRNDAQKLAESITSNERIYRLAKNPLLLTTLLLVERRVGRLPTKRVELYEEAIRVLLETWNRRGHEQQYIDLDEAQYQLSYVAFHMTTSQSTRNTQASRITRSELLKLLKRARRELSELVSGTEKPSDFIKNIERRSALLIQKGYQKNELGEREAVYEFQHLTFQEYLAAYAVNHNCYPGAAETDNPIEVITPHLTNSNMREVIPLIAMRMPRFYPNKLVDVVLSQMQQKPIPYENRTQLRSILLQFVADEIPVSASKIDQILSCCFSEYIYSGDGEIMLQIIGGKHAEKLKARLHQMDVEQNSGFNYHASVLPVILKEIRDPYQYYKENCNHTSVRQRANAISILTHACTENFLGNVVYSREDIKNTWKSELYDLLADKDPIIQLATLSGLNDCEFVNSPKEWALYLNALVNYLNISENCPYVVDCFHLPDICIPIDGNITLSDQGFQRVISRIARRTLENVFTYSEQLTLALVGIVFCLDHHNVHALLNTIVEARQKHINAEPSSLSFLHSLDSTLNMALIETILHSECSEGKKNIVREHILKTEYFWLLQGKATNNFITEYTDYSTCEETQFAIGDSPTLDNPSVFTDKIINHIKSRMAELNIT